MKFTQILVRLILALVSYFSFYGTYAEPTKKWTFLVYMAADNNLEAFVDENIAQMQQIGSNEHINILVYACTHRRGEEKVARKLVIHPHMVQVVGTESGKDSGSDQTLIEAYQWAATQFPAEKVILVLWDHGMGPLNRFRIIRGICYDDTTGNYLTDVKLHNALHTICHNFRQGKPLDIIAFDACLMSSIEVACTVRSYAHHFVASEQTIYAKGFDYFGALQPLKNNPDIQPEAYAHTLVTAFDNFYRPQTANYTLTALRLNNNFDALIETTDSIAQILNAMLEKQAHNSVSRIIRHCRDKALYFTDRTYRDLFHFYQHLLANLSAIKLRDTNLEAELKHKLITKINEACALLKACTIHHVAGARLQASTGLYAYFPDVGIHVSYPELIWAQQHPYWVHFLAKFIVSLREKGLHERLRSMLKQISSTKEFEMTTRGE